MWGVFSVFVFVCVRKPQLLGVLCCTHGCVFAEHERIIMTRRTSCVLEHPELKEQNLLYFTQTTRVHHRRRGLHFLLRLERIRDLEIQLKEYFLVSVHL